MTYSEIRSCYEVMEENKRDVIIGSTQLFTPLQFLVSLQDLHTGGSSKMEGRSRANAEAVVAGSSDKKESKKGFNVFKKK